MARRFRRRLDRNSLSFRSCCILVLSAFAILFAKAADNQKANILSAENTRLAENGDSDRENKYSISLNGHSLSLNISTLSGRGERSVKEQEKTEEASEYLPSIGGVRLKITDAILSLFTSFLFFATLWLYFATDDLAAGAELTSERQLRAYMGMVEINTSAFADAVIKDRVGGWGFVAVWQNSGQTPARHVTVANMKTFLTDLSQEPVFERPKDLEEVFLDSGPNRVLTTQPVGFSIAEIGAIRDGKARGYVCFVCKYFDIFKTTDDTPNQEAICAEIIVVSKDISMFAPDKKIFIFNIKSKFSIID